MRRTGRNGWLVVHDGEWIVAALWTPDAGGEDVEVAEFLGANRVEVDADERVSVRSLVLVQESEGVHEFVQHVAGLLQKKCMYLPNGF